MNFLITANRGEEEPWRIARILRLATIIYGSRDWVSDEVTNIISIGDHKGDLTVNFNVAPQEDFCRWIRNLWECTENEPNCLFEVVGDRIEV